MTINIANRIIPVFITLLIPILAGCPWKSDIKDESSALSGMPLGNGSHPDSGDDFQEKFNISVAETTERGDELLARVKDSWASDSLDFLKEQALTEDNWDAWVADKKVPSKDVEQYHLLKAIKCYSVQGYIGAFVAPSSMPSVKAIYEDISLLMDDVDRLLLPFTLDGRKVYFLTNALCSARIILQFHIELHGEEGQLSESPEQAQAFVLAFCEHNMWHPDAPGEYKITALPTSHPGILAFDGCRTLLSVKLHDTELSAGDNIITRISGVMTPKMLHLSMNLPVVLYDMKKKRMKFYTSSPRAPLKEEYSVVFQDMLNVFGRPNSVQLGIAQATLAEIRGETPAQ